MGSSTQRQTDRGAAAVELALIAIPLLLLVVAIIQFGFAYHAQVTVTQAARAGARLAAICGSTCPTNVTQSTKDAAPGLTPSNITVTIQYCTTGSTPSCSSGYCPAGKTQADGNAVVTVTYPYAFTFGVLTASVSPSVTITGKASLPCGG
ncbi:MAG: TadE/TadG family type IV pilus assembly protein [Jatrophihabitantaceae bacterium]